MIFHTVDTGSRSFADTGEGVGTRKYRLDLGRVGIGAAFFVLLALAAFMAKWVQWDEAATAFLHMAEIAAGGMSGILFGEQMGLRADAH